MVGSARPRLLAAAALAATLGTAGGTAVAQYTPRDSAEESCRRVQQVKTPESDPMQGLAPYEFGFGGGIPLAGESVDMSVDWGDGSPVGRLQESGPTTPGDPDAGLDHTYTRPGTYTWRSSGSRVMLIAISPTEGNLPCTVPISATGTIVVTAPASTPAAPPRAVAGPDGASTVASSRPETAVAAGRTRPAGDQDGGGSSPLWMIAIGALALGAGGVFLGRRTGWLGGPTPSTQALGRATPGGVLADGAEYVRNVHGEVSSTKQAHDAEIAKRREELIQKHLPTVGNNREMAEVLADNELAQYGTNLPMVTDVAKDVLLDAPTKGLRDTWTNLSKWWNTSFGPKP